MADIDMRDKVTVPLKFPFDFNGERITELEIRRPKTRDKLSAKNVKGDEMDKGIHLLANLIERPKELLGEVDEVDLDALQEQYLAFTGRTAEMGAN